jgi:probable addiction module antidote protein
MFRKLDPKKYRDNPVMIAQYLTESFDKNEMHVVLDAIKAILQVQNVTALSEVTGMRRDALYRTFGGKADPLFSTILKLFAGLDVRLAALPLPPRERPPRPKLGRPPSRKQETSAKTAKRQAARKRLLKVRTRANKSTGVR